MSRMAIFRAYAEVPVTLDHLRGLDPSSKGSLVTAARRPSGHTGTLPARGSPGKE
jgi:hypothetical protein